MESIGRWMNILSCILCLTVIPAESQIRFWQDWLESYIVAETELFKAKIQQKGALMPEDYNAYQDIFQNAASDYDFGMVIARRYVMPAEELQLYAQEEAGCDLAKCDSSCEGGEERKFCEVRAQVAEQDISCENGHTYPPEEESCPYCAMTIERLEVKPLRVLYNLGEEPELEVFLHWKNGTKQKTDEWVTDFQPDKSGEQQVTVFCRGIRETVCLIVRQGDRCAFCEEEIPGTNDVCEVCYNTITAIDAKGTAEYGQEPKLLVRLFYQDGHSRILNNGYAVSGYQPYRLGLQKIRVSYQGFFAEIFLEVAMPKPEEAKEEYCEVIQEEPEAPMLKLIYRHEIEEELKTKGFLMLEKGNYFSIIVEKRNVLPNDLVIFCTMQWGRNSFFYTNGGEGR